MLEEKTDSDPVITDERRCHVQLTAELLEAAERPTNKSTLFRRANLNHSRGSQYLEALEEGGLVERSSRTYHLTTDGQEFLDRWKRVQELLDQG